MSDTRSRIQVLTDAIVTEWSRWPSRQAVDRLVEAYRSELLTECIEAVRSSLSPQQAVTRLEAMRDGERAGKVAVLRAEMDRSVR